MRVVMIPEYGAPEVLAVQEAPDPTAGPGEVVVDVQAAGVNFLDLLARAGMLTRGFVAPTPPFVPGGEVAGTVAALGEGVEGQFQMGERVVARVRWGGYCERRAVPVDDVMHLPDNYGFDEGVAVPTAYTLAWEAIVRAGNVRAGERVLIHSAGGGVGIAATQLAKRAGAEVWGTASPAKHDAIRGFGVDHPVDYNQRGWEKQVPKQDLVMDGLGAKSFRRSYKLLRVGGRLICFGISGNLLGHSSLSGGKPNKTVMPRAILLMPWFPASGLMASSKAVIGLQVANLWDEFGTAERWRGPLTELMKEGAIRPVVAATFPFERAPESHRYITERRNIGKVVLTP